MNQLITPVQAWWFTGISAGATLGWAAWVVAHGLPLHPWLSIPVSFGLFVAMYAWSATNRVTLRRLNNAIGYWNWSVVAAIVLAAIFGPVGQPFPQFALGIILKAGAILVVTVTGCGLLNLYRCLSRSSGPAD